MPKPPKDPPVVLVGVTRIREHCTFKWEEPEGGGQRSFVVQENHCPACLDEVKKRGYRLLYPELRQG